MDCDSRLRLWIKFGLAMAFRAFLFKYSQPIAISTVVGGWVGSLAGRQLLADYQLWRSSLFVDNVELKMDDQTLQLFNETKALMRPATRCEPFISESCDPIAIGAFRSTAYLGFPFNINYRSPADVPEHSLYFARESIRLSADDPRRAEMAAALVLSEDAKRFLFARQIAYAESQHCLVTSSVTAASAYLFYSACYFVNRSLLVDPKRFPLLLRLGTYFALGSFVFLLRYSLLTQFQIRLDAKTDRVAAALGPEFARGGLDFYSGLVRRNVLYRALYKSEAEADSHFTRLGNECPGWLRVFGLFAQQRLRGIQKMQPENAVRE